MKTVQMVGDWAPCRRKVEKLQLDSILICNIEAPVLPNGPDGFFQSAKAGPSLYNLEFPEMSSSGIAVLANNHLMDFGVSGLEHTDLIARQAGWCVVGAGSSKSDSHAPIVVNWGGIRLGLLARCETQFGVATNTRAGVAEFDAGIYKQVRSLKSQVDIVIVSLHGASEMVPWPSPRRQAIWRSIIDIGADVVHGHHAHVPQGWEEYNDGLIFYGLGNFCVDPVKWRWHPQGLWSLAPKLVPMEHGFDMKMQTLVIDDLGDKLRVRESRKEEREEHDRYLELCNQPLSDSLLLEGLWQEVSVKMYNQYFEKWLGFGATSAFTNSLYTFRRHLARSREKLFSRSGLGCHPAPSNRHLLWYHMFACDSNNDAISTALGVLGGEIEDRRTSDTARIVRDLVVMK